LASEQLQKDALNHLKPLLAGTQKEAELLWVHFSYSGSFIYWYTLPANAYNKRFIKIKRNSPHHTQYRK